MESVLCINCSVALGPVYEWETEAMFRCPFCGEFFIWKREEK